MGETSVNGRWQGEFYFFGKGGGIYSLNSNTKIRSNIIAENYIPGYPNNDPESGIGIYLRESNSEITNNLIADNKAYSFGALFIDNSNVNMRNCTIVNHKSCEGIYICRSSSAYINNSIIFNNNSSIYLENNSSIEITFSDIQGGWEGLGNIDLDPMILNPDNASYNLCLLSPCIDTGDPQLIDPDVSRSDIGYFSYEHTDCNLVNNWYVSVDGIDSPGNGTEQNPFRSIQYAINKSAYYDTIIVDNGTYIENLSVNSKNVFIASRYRESGDELDILNTIIDGDSSESVVTFKYCNNGASLNGFTITNGVSCYGGGIECYESSPTIEHNIVFGNYAREGGGIKALRNAILEDNIIRNNTASYRGGGIFSLGTISITGNYISSNVSLTYKGGGIYAEGLTDISFNIVEGNEADQGGGIFYCSSNSSINNNLINNNIANSGGGVYIRSGRPLLTNNTVVNNLSNGGSGIYLDNTNPTIINTIIYYNSLYVYYSDPNCNYCAIQGGWTGEGNIDDDPLFCDPENGDFHLMATYCGDPYDSPCIDMGKPSILDSLLDCSWGLGGERSDMGAYSGEGGTVDIDDDTGLPLPQQTSLSQNYPNPFNASTIIKYELPKQSQVTVDVYDILGRRVASLVDDDQVAGYHQVIWSAEDVASGVYFYKIQAGEYIETKKMMLVK